MKYLEIRSPFGPPPDLPLPHPSNLDDRPSAENKFP